MTQNAREMAERLIQLQVSPSVVAFVHSVEADATLDEETQAAVIEAGLRLLRGEEL